MLRQTGPVPLIAFGLAVILLLLIGCTTDRTQQVEPTVTPIPPAERPRNPTYEVIRGEVVDQIQFTGRIAPVVEEELFFRTDGRVRGIYVERDDDVTAGQVLADLEIVESLERQLASDELRLQRAQVNVSIAELLLEIANVQTASVDDEIKLAQANLEAARARYDDATGQDAVAGNALTVARVHVEQAQANLVDAQDAHGEAWDQGRDWELDVSWLEEALENEREATARSLERAQRDLQAAQASYNLTTGGMSDNNALDAQAIVISAEMALEQAQSGQSQYEVAFKEYELELANFALAEALLGKEELEAAIADASIVAPFDGQLLSLSLSEGRSAEAYAPIMALAVMSELEISAELSGRQYDGLVEGMPVVVELVNRPGESLAGTIRRLPYPYGGGGRTEVEEEDKSTRVSLEVPIAETGLDLGDLTRITAVIEQKDDVLWLPPQALRTFEGRIFVVIQDGEVQRRVDVFVGIEGDERVEIEEGLSEGQIVVAP